MKCGILRGNDLHTYRLSQGLMSCGIMVEYLTGTRVAPNVYDIVFVDPSYPEEVQPNIGRRVHFFDCEDDPRHFDPSAAYYSLKDHVEYYAKLVYVEDDRKDGIKNVAFPISQFMTLQQLAMTDDTSMKSSFIPIHIGVPTWLRPHVPVEGGIYHFDEDQDIYSIEKPKEEENNLRYNQRIDWLLSLEKNNIPFMGGLVFKEEEECYSQDFVASVFGEGIRKWAHPRINYMQNLASLAQYKLALCPAGHDRISWRTFDIMAVGSILFWTDVEDRKMLYMPQSYVKVKDGCDLGTVLEEHESDYCELVQEARKNVELIRSLTPPKVKEDFLKQML